jgi:hypothetical protein
MNGEVTLQTHIDRIVWSVKAGLFTWIGGVVMLPILGFLGLIPQH